MDNREANQIWDGIRESKLSKEERAELRKNEEKKVDEMALLWYYMDPITDSARKKNLKEDITNRIFLLFYITEEERKKYGDDATDEIISYLLKALDNFNPDKSDSKSLCHFISSNRSNKFKDAYKKGVKKLNIISGKDDASDDKTKKARTVRVDNVRYNSESGKEESVFDSIIDPYNNKMPMGKIVEIEELFDDYTHNIIGLMQRLEPHRPKVKWFKIFYTEGITDLININTSKDCYLGIRFKHERDVLDAINSDYLNFYMKNHCDTIRDIRESPLKLYGEIMNDVDDEKASRMIDLPLIDNPDVSIAYHEVVLNEKVSKPNRSNFLKIYKEDYRGFFI